jgi:hypothetical protein
MALLPPFIQRSFVGAHPQMASCGPYLRSPIFEILDAARLCLRFQKWCGLDLNHNLPFADGHALTVTAGRNTQGPRPCWPEIRRRRVGGSGWGLGAGMVVSRSHKKITITPGIGQSNYSGVFC